MKAVKSISGMLVLTAFLTLITFQTNSFAKSKPVGKTQHIDLQVSGMMCSNCSKNLESSLGKFKGAENVKADYSTGCACLDVPSTSHVTKAQLQKAVVNAGFMLKEVKFTETNQKSPDLKQKSQ